jgi:hypothetical protein
MAKFSVEVYESSARVVEVEAETVNEALDIVEKQYNNEEIVLDSNDFQDVKFTVI